MNLLHTAEVNRKVSIDGKGLAMSFETVYCGVRCLSIPVDPKDVLQANLTVGKDYIVYFDGNADIRQSDQLTISTGVILLVNGIANYSGLGNVSHLEVMCTTKGD